jgi:hypothetical protein
LGGDVSFPPDSSSDSKTLDERGTEAIAACNPLNPVAEASTSLAEAHREGLPSLPGIQTWKSRTKPLLGIAGEFLNTEFGWLPLVSEVKSFANAVINSHKILDQYVRDSGRTVRRQFSFPISQSTSYSTPATGHAIYGNGQWSRAGLNKALTGAHTVKKVTSRKTWFSGAFTYHIPSDMTGLSGLYDQRSQAGHLLGTTLTPETLWELTPWSWAVDWFSDAQQVVENLDSFKLYGLVMRYGYIMEETSTVETHTLTGSNLPTTVSPVTVSTVTKVRRRANPFGFGLEWADLSPVQLAIAAAVGITQVL